MPLNVLIDGNNFAIRILTSVPGYNSQFQSSHQANLFIHSFFAGLLSTTNKIKQKYTTIDNINIIWDSRINNRKKLYSEYKANRKPKTLEEERDKTNHYSLLDQLKSSLKTLGDWACIEREGYEADDLIAYFVKESAIDDTFVIISSDNDLYQLLNDRCVMYLPHRKEFYTILDFQKEFDISPNKYPFVKALAGDRSDNIKGIEGIGIKKGIKLIKEGQCWTHWINKYKEVDLETNLELVSLPFENDKINLTMPQSYFEKRAWVELFQKFGLSKLNLSDFKQLFILLANATKENNKLV